MKRRRIVFLAGVLLWVGMCALVAAAPWMRWWGLRPNLREAEAGEVGIPFWLLVLAGMVVGGLVLAAVYWGRKRLFFSAAGLVVLVGATALWVFSYSRIVALDADYEHVGAGGEFVVRPVEVIVSHGGIAISYFPQRRKLEAGSRRMDPGFVNPSPNPSFTALGDFGGGSGVYPSAPDDDRIFVLEGCGFSVSSCWMTPGHKEKRWGLIFPIWFMVVAAGVAASWWPVWVWRRGKAFKEGDCRECGYDLRGSGERCSECGLAVVGKAGGGAGVG